MEVAYPYADMYMNSRVTSGRHDDVMTAHEIPRKDSQQNFYDSTGSLDLRVQTFLQKQDEPKQEHNKVDWAESTKVEQR